MSPSLTSTTQGSNTISNTHTCSIVSKCELKAMCIVLSAGPAAGWMMNVCPPFVNKVIEAQWHPALATSLPLAAPRKRS